jgi:hypothetical protein
MYDSHTIKLTSTGKKFFGTKKNTLRLVVVDKPVELYGGYWNGGSRNEYRGLTKSGSTVDFSYPTTPREYGGGEAPSIPMTDDLAVIVDGVFCGKTRHLTVYINKLEGWNDTRFGTEVVCH